MSALLEDYPNKYLIISESLEIASFDTISEAYRYGVKTYGLGNFLLQECNEEADKVQIISNMGCRIA